LARERARGWSLSLGGDETGGTHAELLDAIDRYSDGDREGRQHVQRLGGALAEEFEPVEEFAPDARYDVRLVSVPVFGPDGSVPLALTLWGLPGRISGDGVHRYLDVLRAAAAAIGALLAERAD
jgi:hypothetical protein